MSGITIRGTLVGHAYVRLTAEVPCKVYIYADVQTGEHDEPIHVRWRVPGLGYAPEISGKARADRLRKGTAVMVRAGGIVAAPFGRLMARDVEYIEPGADMGAGAMMDRVAP